jgi:hypothetical protein
VCVEVLSYIDITSSDTQACAEAGGTFSRGSCSADRSVGRCEVRESSQDMAYVHYAPLTAEHARQLCAKKQGTFTSPTTP